MINWGQSSQRFQASGRCITISTACIRKRLKSTRPQNLKNDGLGAPRRKYSPHPAFDLLEYQKSNPVENILGLKKPTHRLLPPEAFEAALARAQSTSGALLQTLNRTRKLPLTRPKRKLKEIDQRLKFSYERAANVAPATKKPFKPLAPALREPTPPPPRRPAFGAKPSRTRPGDWISESWGEDKLRPTGPRFPLREKPKPLPPRFNEDLKRPDPPHRRSPLSYSRRIEGLLEASSERALEDLKPTSKHLPIAQLAHGLDRVLFNPGVHWLQDPRSRVYNFPPYLENIPKVNDFAFERLSGFIKSSRDEDLWELAKREGRTFAGSTSSLTGMLSQIYFLISGNRDVDATTLSRAFALEPTSFTPGQRMPSSVVFNYKDGVYSIDSGGDAATSDKNILTWMGTLLEKYLTMTPEEFSTYMRSEAPPTVDGEKTEEPMREAYRYAKSERFVMRSQLDCVDKRLPGTGVFDVKTRACLPIRMDMLNFEENSGYLIRKQYGAVESFEKEYYDLIRSAFLKYSFQVRIGNMDGVIVAYHNTARMFGFQYISLEEMDQRLFGSAPGIGDRVFDKCVGLLEKVADEVIKCFPEESVQCTFETQEATDTMNVWVEPAEWTSDEPRPIKQLQVTVENFIGEDQVRGSTAVSSDGAWTTHWSIGLLSGKDHDPHVSLQGAKGRQFRAYNIPTGVDHADMAEFWYGLDFGGKALVQGKEGAVEEGAPYIANQFRPPSGNVVRLRELARAGRQEAERLREEERGKPLWVLGDAEPITRIDDWVEPGEPVAIAQADMEGVELETVVSGEVEVGEKEKTTLPKASDKEEKGSLGLGQ